MYFWESIRPLDPLPVDYREKMSNVQAALAIEGLAHTLQTVQIPVYERLTDQQIDLIAAVIRDAVLSRGSAAPEAGRQ